MEELLQLVWKSYGLVGFLILLPVVACVFLWRQNLALQKNVMEQAGVALDVQKQRSSDHAKRLSDYERMMETLVKLVREQTALNAETNSVLGRVSETVERLERHILSGGRS